MQCSEDEHPYEGGPEEDSDYGSIRSGDSDKVSNVALLSGIDDLSDSDNQLAPLHQPSSDERPPIVFYHLEGRPKTPSSMDWETADKFSDLDSGQEEGEIVLGVSPSQLERLFFSNDYIEVMEVPTYGQVEYVSYGLYDKVAVVPGSEATVKKSARIEPPDRLIVEDTVTVHGPPPPPIPVPEMPALSPLKVESPPPPSPSERTPPPVKEPTPPPVLKPKKRQIIKKKKEQPPPRVRERPEESNVPSAGPMEPPLEPTPVPLPEVEEAGWPAESPSGPTPDLGTDVLASPEAEIPESSELQEHRDGLPISPRHESTEFLKEDEEQDIIPGTIEEKPTPSPVQSPTPSIASLESTNLSDNQADVSFMEGSPTPGDDSPDPPPEEEPPHPPEEEPHTLPPAVKDPEFLAEQERERLAEERRLKAHNMFDRLKARRFIPSDITAETAPREDVKHMIRGYDGWLAQFFIIKEDKAKMYQQVFDVVDEDGDGFLSCFETLIALKGITGAHKLTEQEEAYIIRVLELAEYPVTQGTDLRLFSVLASLSQRIVSVDEWVRNLINSLDLTSLEWKITRAKELFEWCLQGDSRRLQVDKLLVELKAGGVSAEHQEEVQVTLGSKGSWDMLDFFSYLPLFIMTHTSVVDNPLDDSRAK